VVNLNRKNGSKIAMFEFGMDQFMPVSKFKVLALEERHEGWWRHRHGGVLRCIGWP
jgi:hypothetical protein